MRISRLSLLALALVAMVSIGIKVATAQTRPSGILPLTMRVNGTPVPLGQIVSAGTSINNHTTAAPFNDTSNGLSGKVLLLSPTASGRILPVTTNSGTTTATEGGATTGVPVAAGERVIIVMQEGYSWVAWIPDTTGNLRVWELN